MTSKSNKDAPYKHCGICSQLADREYAIQKHGREEQDVFLPASVNSLKTVRDLKPHSGSRLLMLKQCPECDGFYLYKTDYEFLADGSEDEQLLTRLTDEEAAEYLKRPLP